MKTYFSTQHKTKPTLNCTTANQAQPCYNKWLDAMKTMHFDTLSHIRSTPSMAMNWGICSFWTAFCRADAIILTRLSDEPIEKANIGSWTPFEIQHRWDFCVRLKHRLYWIFDGVTMTFNILTLFLGNAVNIPEISFRQRNNQFWLSFQWHCLNCFKSDSFRRQRNDFSVFPLPQLKWRPFAIVGKTLCLFRLFPRKSCQIPQIFTPSVNAKRSTR